MRINIIPKTGLLSEAHAFSATNHRIVNHNIISEIAFWSSDGKLLEKRDSALSNQDYLIWCGMGANDPDDPFFTQCHMNYQGCVPAPVPPPTPDPEPEPDPEP